jgi:hypothetical protein
MDLDQDNVLLTISKGLNLNLRKITYRDIQ